MTGVDLYFLFNLVLFAQVDPVSSACTMPTAWLGSWYQRDMNSLLDIAADRMQTKGACLDALPLRHYYLFHDRSSRCTRCMVFIQRHVNLLQYRESECNDQDEALKATLCPQLIAPDAALYTLHRNGSHAQSCPLRAPFQVVNLVQDGLMCPQSITSSYISECADPHRLHLHLAACASYPPAIDFQFDCAGTWMEDFYTYFVARIITPDHRKNRYACFRFLTKHKSASILVLHMAADDSCRDLYSKYMSTTITLSMNNRHERAECTFPKALQSHTWRSISGALRMFIRNDEIAFTGRSQRFHCEEMIDQNAITRIYRVRSLTHCRAKELCLRISQRAENVLELETSSLSREGTCTHLTETNSRSYETYFIPPSPSAHACPSHVGHLIYRAKSNSHLLNRTVRMAVGCDGDEQITVAQPRADTRHKSVVSIGTCLATWQSDDSRLTYLIVQSAYSNASYCLSFQMADSILIRNSSQTCSVHERAIATYSARRLHPCAAASALAIAPFRLPMTLTIIIIITNEFYVY